MLVASQATGAASLLLPFLFVLMLATMGGFGAWAAAGLRREAGRLQSVEEAVTLRQWPVALGELHELLSSPMRTPTHRVQALLLYSATLARYHRFADAIIVHDYLLSAVQFDGGTTLMVKSARAMAMLREDRLWDADRAINDLRRTPGSERSALGTLVELYRDVKTGHPDEAVTLFEERRSLFATQLGHRSADAWALVGRAYDLLGRSPEAQAAFTNATLLAPWGELVRRYPEVEALAQKYSPAVAPLEAA
jgi:hypothetical protein